MEQSGLAAYYFHQGTNERAYEYLGVHLTMADNGEFSYVFRVWAPGASAVGVTGDFTSWETSFPMIRVTERGIWEYTFRSTTSLEWSAYKYLITGRDGKTRYKGDPYAFASRGGADGASLIVHPSGYRWQDETWFSARRRAILGDGQHYLSCPMNIYEVHPASFLRREDGSYLTYRELADVLVPYVKHMGYTHVELLPVMEYPFDGSWGYQVCAFYAPTCRFGRPDDFRYFVDTCHRNGVGVLLDWVPAHFPKDGWGLYEFDGQPLYEYQGRDRMESDSWGTRFFDLGREEVQSFLISNAFYYVSEFHVDGLRVDAVASMLYLDYDRRPGEWIPNEKGGRENLEAIAFLRKLNGALLGAYPDVLMIAEESTAFSGVTHPVSEGGLGFSMKWNMGFANDLFAYLSSDPIYRKYHHEALTFPLMYAYTENYVLPVSHDEVVHGKRSFIDKMYGAYEDKFRQARAALLLMMTYPGKKMLFMGTEFAQFREWDFASSLEWFMLDYPMHRAMREYVAALNRFYLASPELWAEDFDPDGFSWILADEREKNLVAYRRRDGAGHEMILLISFSGAVQEVTLPAEAGRETLLFSTDETFSLTNAVVARDAEHITLRIPAYTGMIFRWMPKKKTLRIQKTPTIHQKYFG